MECFVFYAAERCSRSWPDPYCGIAATGEDGKTTGLETGKKIDGRFDKGEVITMRKARSKSIAGYEVWLGYDYEAEGQQVGVYRLPRKSKDEADTALSTLAHQRIVVRVAPGNPKRSFVSDEDLIALLPARRPLE